jgi:SRSO17 transposase
LESIKWNEEKVRDRCQQIVATEHAHPEAIGIIDESGIGKSGSETAGAAWQYNGNHGKVEDCVVGVHLGYSAPGFRTVVDSRLYLPKDLANDPEYRKIHYIPDEISFQTKPGIGLDLIDRALGNGIRVKAWTFDELYARDSKFLDGLEERQQVFVAEIPQDTRASPPIFRSTGTSRGGGDFASALMATRTSSALRSSSSSSGRRSEWEAMKSSREMESPPAVRRM